MPHDFAKEGRMNDPIEELKDLALSHVQERQNDALRYDEGKIRYDLLPADSIQELARVYTKGAAKYAERNWEKGMSWSRCFGSLMRHAWAFWRGETHDQETGCHHMAMAAWNCLALCSYDMRQIGEDNRPQDTLR